VAGNDRWTRRNTPANVTFVLVGAGPTASSFCRFDRFNLVSVTLRKNPQDRSSKSRNCAAGRRARVLPNIFRGIAVAKSGHRRLTKLGVEVSTGVKSRRCDQGV